MSDRPALREEIAIGEYRYLVTSVDRDGSLALRPVDPDLHDRIANAMRSVVGPLDDEDVRLLTNAAIVAVLDDFETRLDTERTAGAFVIRLNGAIRR